MRACDGTSRGMGNYRAWTQADKDTLRRLHGENVRPHQIAEIMGVGYNRVRDMIFRLGLRHRRPPLPAATAKQRADDRRAKQREYLRRRGPAIDPGDPFVDDLDETERMWRRAQPLFEDGPVEPEGVYLEQPPADARELQR